MYKIIGTCSACAGAMVVPELWSGVIPPTPHCLSCKRQALNPFGKVIQVTDRAELTEHNKRLSERAFQDITKMEIGAEPQRSCERCERCMYGEFDKCINLPRR